MRYLRQSTFDFHLPGFLSVRGLALLQPSLVSLLLLKMSERVPMSQTAGLQKSRDRAAKSGGSLNFVKVVRNFQLKHRTERADEAKKQGEKVG